MSKRLYLTKMDIKQNTVEWIKECMPNVEDFNKFMKNYNRNPFISRAFELLIPSIFAYEGKEKSREKKVKKRGVFALMERNEARSKQAKKESYTLDEYIVAFISDTEQPFDIVDRITYTYMKTISIELKNIKEKRSAGGKKEDISSISTKMGG